MADKIDISPEAVALMLDGLTKGPWTVDPDGDVVSPDGPVAGPFYPDNYDTWPTWEQRKADARFIAWARDAVPAMVKRIAELDANQHRLECENTERLRELAERDACPLGIPPESHDLCSAGTCNVCLSSLRERLVAAEANLQGVCQREAETIKRYDAKLEVAKAENARLREALNYIGLYAGTSVLSGNGAAQMARDATKDYSAPADGEQS